MYMGSIVYSAISEDPFFSFLHFFWFFSNFKIRWDETPNTQPIVFISAPGVVNSILYTYDFSFSQAP